MLDSNGNTVAKYVYDAWGNHVVLDANGNEITDETHIGNLNPFRYRGYYFDTETELYYLKSRYYDPKIGRFITIDDHTYLDPDTVNGINLYAYCLNNPVMAIDPTGHWIETVFDLFSLGASIVEVIINPADPWAWAGLVGDAVDLLPFVTGVGETVKATKLVKYADEVIDASHDTIKFVKAADNVADFADDGLDIVKTLDKTKEGFTISNKLDGTKIHKSFMENGMRIPNTRMRVDGMDSSRKIIYELKPYNLISARRGVKQILGYDIILGGGYKKIIVLY